MNGQIAIVHRFGVLILLALTLASIPAAAQPQSDKAGETIRATADQMHQLAVTRVELYPFRLRKAAIGQIAYNEDTSTVVLTPFSGRVTRLIAKIGDKVKRGDPLFEIDSPEVVLPQNDFIAASATLNKARSQLNLATIAEKRAKDLFEGKAGALKEWQASQALLVGAQNDLRAAETALEAARNRLRIIGRSEAQITALHERGAIERTIPITAPIDGTVISRKVGPGQYVRSDSNDPLYGIADLSTMWLKAFIPEADVPFVRVGEEIEVRIAALPGRVFKAQIKLVGSASDVATRRVAVYSEIPNPDGVLKAEMFANFIISSGEAQSSPAVPVEAVIREANVVTVWVEREPMLFQRRKIEIGIEQNGQVQVRGGLQAGETVVTRGAIFVDNEWRQ